MTNRQYYCIMKQNKVGDVVYFDSRNIQDGFQITPKNQMQYDGITVNKLIIIKHTFIEKLLKKKIKKKLELYLQYIITIIEDDDDSDSGTLNELLTELSRYKGILKYKYEKYLGEEYVLLMTQKIELLEYELKLKAMNLLERNMSMSYENDYEEEDVNSKSR